MIDQRGRSWLTKHIVSPIGKVLVRLHISASMVTTLGLVVSLTGAVILANGHPIAAGLVIGLGGGIDGVEVEIYPGMSGYVGASTIHLDLRARL